MNKKPEIVKVVIINPFSKVAEAVQRKAAREWINGADFVAWHTVGKEGFTLDDVQDPNTIREGDIVGVYTADLLVDRRKLRKRKNRPAPKAHLIFTDISRGFFETGATLYETGTGRTSTTPAEMSDMINEARTRLSRARPGLEPPQKGRKPHHVYSDDDVLWMGDQWELGRSQGLKNNALMLRLQSKFPKINYTAFNRLGDRYKGLTKVREVALREKAVSKKTRRKKEHRDDG